MSDLLEGLPITERSVPPESRQGDTPPVWRAPQKGRMPPDRERVPLQPASRRRPGFLDEVLEQAENELRWQSSEVLEVATDASNGQIVRHRDGRPVMTRKHRPWTEQQYETRRRQVRDFIHAIEKAGEVSLQAESHRLGVTESQIADEAAQIAAEAADLREEMSYGRITAVNASARLEDLRRRQERCEDRKSEYLGAVERHAARRERGGYAYHMGILQRYPALHEGIVTALRAGTVPEVRNPYGHYDDLDPSNVESPVYKARRQIEEKLEPLRAKLHARDQLRSSTRSVTEEQDRRKYPQLRDRV